jgi:transposase
MSDRDKAEDQSQKWALFRYMVISAYLALAPPRGQRGATLSQLAAKAWVGPDGEPVHVAAETIRKWIARYQHDGLDGLRNRAHPGRGPQALTPELVDLVCQLKREVPERSLDRLIRIAERMELVEPGSLRRSTVHRVLRAHGLSKRALRIPDTQDLDRFEADYANGL